MGRPNTSAEVARRRAQVTELSRQGCTIRQIAEQLGIGRSTVTSDRHELGITSRAYNVEALAERRAIVAKLVAEGWTLDQMAARLNTTPRTVARDKYKLKLVHPIPHLSADECEQAEKLLDAGASFKEVARTLGRAPWTIQKRFPGRGWTPEQTGQFNALRGLREALDV